MVLLKFLPYKCPSIGGSRLEGYGTANNSHPHINNLILQPLNLNMEKTSFKSRSQQLLEVRQRNTLPDNNVIRKREEVDRST